LLSPSVVAATGAAAACNEKVDESSLERKCRLITESMSESYQRNGSVPARDKARSSIP